MPFGGNDWLALTEEPTLEPELPICDPITTSGTTGWSASPTSDTCCTNLADDINSGHNVRSTVFIEARSMYRADGPDEMRRWARWSSCRGWRQPAPAACTA